MTVLRRQNHDKNSGRLVILGLTMGIFLSVLLSNNIDSPWGEIDPGRSLLVVRDGVSITNNNLNEAVGVHTASRDETESIQQPEKEEERARAIMEQQATSHFLQEEVTRLKADNLMRKSEIDRLEKELAKQKNENERSEQQIAATLDKAKQEQEALKMIERRSSHLGSHIIPTSPYAYSWILGGIDLSLPNYKGYLYGIIVSAYQLRRLGSEADMLLWVEFHHNSPQNQVFPERERELLRILRINLIQIPSMKNPSFYELQLQKFRILGLTQYRRVMHLDGDIIATTNLDKYFEYTDPDSKLYRRGQEEGIGTQQPTRFYGKQNTLLEENFIVNGPNDMSNGGFFILTPHPGDLEQIQQIIEAKERKVAENKGKFDTVYGWGHKYDGEWIGAAVMGNKDWRGEGWTWFAASGDQGLLWYWVAYVKRRFSRAGYRDDLERWLPRETNRTGPDDEIVYLKDKIRWPHPSPDRSKGECFYKFCNFGARGDFYHFMGFGKPWKGLLPRWRNINEKTKYQTPEHLWRYVMLELNQKYRLGLNMSDLEQEKSVPYVLKQNPSSGVFTNLLTKGSGVGVVSDTTQTWMDGNRQQVSGVDSKRDGATIQSVLPSHGEARKVIIDAPATVPDRPYKLRKPMVTS